MELSMNRPLVYVVSLAMLVAGAWLGVSRMIGDVVATEVTGFEVSLAALDHVQVNRLEYKRRWFDGVIEYDLLVRPLPGDPLYGELRELLGSALDRGVRVDGRLQVRHGPWLGDGIGLARATGGIALPEGLRVALPNYPGQRPLIDLVARMSLARAVEVQLSGTDYRGRVVLPDEPLVGSLVFAGLRGEAVLTSTLDAIRWSVQLGEVALDVSGAEPAVAAIRDFSLRGDLVNLGSTWRGSIDGGIGSLAFSADEANGELGQTRMKVELSTRPGQDAQERQAIKVDAGVASLTMKASDAGELRFGPMRLTADTLREWSALWTGTAEFSMEAIRMVADGLDVALDSLVVGSDIRAVEGAVDQSLDFNLGTVSVNGVALGKGRIRTLATGFDGDGLNQVLVALERAAYDEHALERPEFQEMVKAGVTKWLSRQPAIAIDPLAIELTNPDDASARLLLRFRGEPGLTLDNPLALLARIELEAGISMRQEALREWLRRGLQVAADGSQPEAGLEPSSEDIAREADERFAGMMETVAQVPFLETSGDRITLEATFREGQLTINGQPADDLASLGSLFDLPALFGGEGRGQAALEDELSELDWTQPGLFGNINLDAGFTPDPHEISIMAGGDSWLDGEWGVDCIGYVNTAQADVVLDYTAGDWPLFIYAESDEDTTLIVRAPDGQWHCNDDDRGLDPGLAFDNPESGRYAIWVGTYIQTTAVTTLSISELAVSPE